MQRVYRLIRLVAPRKTTVLVTGPTGSGKELVARAVHELSPRNNKPFIAINCAAIPEALLESELFGYTQRSVPANAFLLRGDGTEIRVQRSHRMDTKLL
jgi:transcriptional regulator with PAS, ATPase and Fis domain